VCSNLRTGDPDNLFFFPPTFVLPEDYNELDIELQNKKPKTYICKPDGGAQVRFLKSLIVAQFTVENKHTADF